VYRDGGLSVCCSKEKIAAEAQIDLDFDFTGGLTRYLAGCEGEQAEGFLGTLQQMLQLWRSRSLRKRLPLSEEEEGRRFAAGYKERLTVW
jgi:hypothetical protein